MVGQYRPDLPATVERDFTHAGRKLRRGDTFAHRELCTHDLEIRGLYAAGLISFNAPLQPPVGEQPRAAPSSPREREPQQPAKQHNQPRR